MNTFISLIVLTTLVAQLPQLQAQEAETQPSGFYATSCSFDITKTGIFKYLSDQYGSSFRIEIRCGHPTSFCTRLTHYEGTLPQSYVDLCIDESEYN